MRNNRRGLMIIISSPSGNGKTTIAKALTESDPNIKFSISVTTRPKRRGEVDGKDYYFISKERFDEMKENQMLLEDARVFDNYYGTPRQQTMDSLAAGIDVLYDINWDGGLQLMKSCREDVVSIFMLPPSIDELEKRMRSRATEDEAAIKMRLIESKKEISKSPYYDYTITNHKIETTLQEIKDILQKERAKRAKIL